MGSSVTYGLALKVSFPANTSVVLANALRDKLDAAFLLTRLALCGDAIIQQLCLGVASVHPC